jgi:hypothetical protein
VRRKISIATLVAALAAMVALGAAAPSRPQAATQGAVRGCRPFVLSKSHLDGKVHRFRAWEIRRSADLRCSMVRALLRGAYGSGPLKVVRTTFDPTGSGRPTYWLEGGWRCGNGAGGAGCFNAEKPDFNVIESLGTSLAVTASTR